jgi:hypothetical protein
LAEEAAAEVVQEKHDIMLPKKQLIYVLEVVRFEKEVNLSLNVIF